MNGNAELLNFVYQNSQMGVDTLKQLNDIAEDGNFKKHLESQYNEYKKINDSAKKMLNKNGFDEKRLSALEKIRTYLMLNAQTLTDNSPSHISEMLIVGSNMGIVNAVKNMKRYSGAEPEILGLMNKLLKTEENNVRELKGFLQ